MRLSTKLQNLTSTMPIIVLIVPATMLGRTMADGFVLLAFVSIPTIVLGKI